mmetsp:Transcript_14115/g.60418  ORF Transcript_14115/g.60418 Transcript_14115/m.60418 type:complete len:205 (-) Transcript_14115:91-705(-)
MRCSSPSRCRCSGRASGFPSCSPPRSDDFVSKREARAPARDASPLAFFFVLYLLLVYYRNATRAAFSLVSATPRHRMVHLHEHLCTCATPPKKNLPRPRRRRVLRGGFGDVLGAQPRRSRSRQHVRSLRERDGRVVEERQLEPRVFFRVDGELEPLHHRRQVHRRREQRERASDATPRTRTERGVREVAPAGDATAHAFHLQRD